MQMQFSPVITGSGRNRKMSFDCKASSSLYEVLRVNRNASPVEIKTAYRSLAKVYHPDSFFSSNARDFINIHNPYSTLSDPSSREMYDLTLPASLPAPASASAFLITRRWETDQCW